ncbi:stalk domain-containing protein [Bacillus sp. FJAT-26390]|uniref:stalk domain-containing protein n=1 Tax=Bacillus sp. FJAT-26390 TaxID=1743142 RepID=UPI000807C774|nr:stalk domain-containing protein [Bacillus sp. FJAT-26390]OBZ09906.1 hypothetical protein A7975_21205 [Bacillus sp. FJAT-26390]
MKMNVYKRMLAMLLPALLILAMLPIAVFAADAGNKVEVRLKTGSPTVKINGKATTVEPPFVSNGTTMVPLKVITNAFGAGLKLENGNVITLTYNDRKIVLTFGSKTVKVNGAAKAVAVAPVVVKGSTMVPLRVIVEAFGAKITADSATKETVIVGVHAQSSGDGGTSIDSDFGKTKVGDSYYGWSLKYPAGLVQVYQSDNGDAVKWADTADASKVAAQVNVFTESVGEDELTSEEKRDLIFSYYEEDEITVDKRTITVDGLTFEKVISYTKQSKMYYEFRGIQKGDTFYIVIVGAKGADKSVLNSYDAFLNSFVPSFNGADTALKDITKVKNGLITFKESDYGLTVKLPADWSSDPESTTPWYENDTDAFQFSFSAAAPGDTLENWASRREARIREDNVSSSLRNITTAPITLQDGNALSLSYEISYGDNIWFSYIEVAYISGDYRYLFDYIYPSSNSAKSKQLFKQIIDSVDIDIAYIEKSFGTVEEDINLVDRSAKTTKRSSTYGYSIEVPTYWNGLQTNFNKDTVLYTYSAGNLQISQSDKQADALVVSLSQLPGSSDGIAQEVKLRGASEVTINGKKAQRVEIHVSKPENDIPYSHVLYIFDTAKGSIVFSFITYDIKATESNLKIINDAAQSIRFN